MDKKYAKTPTVYQMEMTECGAASLAMVLAYYGKFLPLEQLRVETGVSRDGCNMKNIMIAARRLGMEAHGYRKNLEKLFTMPVPSIIHWNFNHFVVWEGKKGKYCYINDPAVGRRKLTVQDISDCYTGVILTLQPTEAFTKSKAKETLWTFAGKRLNGQKSAIAALLALGLLLVLPGIIIPVFSRVFIDDILIGGNNSWMLGLLAAMIGTMLFQGILYVYRSLLLQRLQNKLTLLSGYKFLHHMLRLPMSFFGQRSAGDLSQRISNNNNVNIFLTGSLAETLLNMFVALFYLILLFLYSPVLTLIGLGSVIINLGAMWYSSKELGDMTMKTQQDLGKLVGTLFSGLKLIDTLKASGTENEYVSRILGNFAKGAVTHQKTGMVQEMLNAIPSVSENILTVLTLIVGGIEVIRGNMTPGMLIAYTSLQSAFISPVNQLSGFVKNLQTTKADMGRVNDIMKYEPDKKFDEREYADITEKLNGRVSLSDISFGHDILKPPLVEHFSFSLEPGRSVALVGTSGSGKSTAAKLCSGLYHPWSGEILLDDVPISEIPPEILSVSISTVSQEITLFSGTIRDNLTMWDNNILNSDIIAATRDACIHDFITSLPGAFDYNLKEMGTNLSGGQRQRMEIARALVQNPSILIMDEATSALDPTVEKEILDNIKKRGITCIIVAHRLSAIRDCDEILVMNQGRIVQRGTHEELSQIEGHYQNLIANM